jgi:hypothetical protein
MALQVIGRERRMNQETFAVRRIEVAERPDLVDRLLGRGFDD